MNTSERLYRLLLRLYPRDHRRDYGQLMLTHFRDQYQEARRDGVLLDLWLRTLIDVARTAPMEHIAAARLQNVYAWPEVLLAILLPLAACLLLLIVLPPLVYSTSPYIAGRFDAATLLRQSLHHTLYAIQILAGAALALTLYGNIPSKSDRLSLAPDNWLTH